ncbi:uncharacterized protein (DUF2141 family) [Dysgonomonas sp. PH5-45]|uniref:Ig-like domain-containing protein n=1 Tax=unclassified Dysgonomonas TaxID=2630389 RepID=UPI0024769176|nr:MULTISPECIES: Ig-like domain-containing protein [unclassified Dysgonomonas]MDH6353847.1 uncharacterized protein (DUF2141 family) [Dysgonomonas sp. PH5-45]MDH6386749.1 uncharacterized protein (DUF2141 family) [Dysgonomonas sp. PH5-37]
MSLSRSWYFNVLGKTASLLSVFLAFYSCASIGSPSGGDYDLDPPKVISCSPQFNALNVANGKITIEFDELVQVENPNEKVIITPPQSKMPVIQAISNKVKVELRDSLLPNTTYTIDFTDAIVDYNEGNPLESFSLSFSTGDKLDSLVVSGKVLAAENLEPVKGFYVGLHSNLNDSAFTKNRFLRISRTNDKGEFAIRGIAEGEYRIYALNDLNRDYKYDNPSEDIAFLGTTIIPFTAPATRLDTIYNQDVKAITDSAKLIEEIREVSYTRFLPDDILLRSFSSGIKRQYLQKYERPSASILKIYFGAPTAMPQIEPLNFDKNKEWALLEKTPQNDTLTYWITDASVAGIDTLSFKITYPKTDSLNQLVPTTDTLHFVDKTRKPKKENDDKDKEITFLNIKTNISGIFDVDKNISVEFEKPVPGFADDKNMRLYSVVDSVETQIDYNIEADSLNPRKYLLIAKLEAGNKFKLVADSANIWSYDGFWNKPESYEFTVRPLSQYGQLYIDVTGLDKDAPAFIELLDKSDAPVRKRNVRDGGALFKNLLPGTYYARIIIDENNNGMWDTGNFEKGLQPEMVYYYNKPFEIKANWKHGMEEPWNIQSLPLDQQKPTEILKNKPTEKKTKRQELEERDAKKNKQSATPDSNKRVKGNEFRNYNPQLN